MHRTNTLLTWWFCTLVFLTGFGIVAVDVGIADDEQPKIDLLLIGTSGSLHPEKVDAKTERSVLETLKGFIKDETGFTSEIKKQTNWSELGDQLANGKVHLGVFHGYEFAWAQDKYTDLKPLALAVNVHRYPVACLMVKADNPAKAFADLKGYTLDIPDTADRYLQLFVNHQATAAGAPAATFFSKITANENVEDALDGVVDGAVQATVVDKAALEGYERRKPARFKKLREIARSQPFPPTVVAYFGDFLDQPTLKRFQDGVFAASRKEKGQTLLTLFRLTDFEPAPQDFAKVVADTRKIYEPSITKAP